ncbi:hypothetical protein, partial [Klebsiella pneumoniae]|uniref:hypothetical protein n=1 Tax=Klebsiella pneumoniae TaxID=573 RepID=UPI0038547184
TAWDLGVALNHALESIGRATIPLEEARGLIGGGTGPMLLGGLARTGGLDGVDIAALTDRLVAFYADNIAHHTRLDPGGEAMLADLESRGVM